MEKITQKQNDFINNLLEGASSEALEKSAFLREKGIKELSKKDASYLINILKKYTKNTDDPAAPKKAQKKAVKNDHPFNIDDLLYTRWNSDYGYDYFIVLYHVTKTTKKQITFREVKEVKEDEIIYRNEEKEKTKKVHVYAQKPSKQDYFIEPYGNYSMSKSAYFYKTLKDYQKEIKDNRIKEEKEAAARAVEAEKAAAEYRRKKEEKAAYLKNHTIEEYYGIDNIKTYKPYENMVKVLFNGSKHNDIDDFNEWLHHESCSPYISNCTILKSFTIKNDHLLYDLMEDNESIYNKIGGSDILKGAYNINHVIEVIYKDKKYYINTEGYDYARYFGIFEEYTTIEEIYNNFEFNISYINTAIEKAVEKIRDFKGYNNTLDQFLSIIFTNSNIKSFINSCGYDDNDIIDLKNELIKYYNKHVASIKYAANKNNTTLLFDFN